LTDLVLAGPSPAALIPEFAAKLIALERVRLEQTQLRDLVQTGQLDSSQLELIVVRCADVSKVVDAERKRNLEPVNKIWDEINTHFSPLVKEAAAIRALVEAQLAANHEQAALTKADAMRAAASHHLAGAHQAASEALAVANAASVQPESKVALKGKWKARITDPTIVPRQYCGPDQKLLDNCAKVIGPTGGTVAGVEFYRETTVRVKGKGRKK